MEWSEILFWVMALATCVCALGVVISREVVHAAVWLLFTLASVAGLFFLLGGVFVGTVQLMVYVGGTLVLLVFGVMLTARTLVPRTQASGVEWVLGITLGALVFAVIMAGIYTTDWRLDTARLASVQAPETADETLQRVADDRSTTLIGQALLTRYLLPFEIISVHLLVVLIAAAYLARARRGTAKPSQGGEST